jgi:hypothetical protein
MKKPKLTRREFMGAAGAAATFLIVPRSMLGGTAENAPSNKLNIASIGISGMGAGDVNDVSNGNNMVALCDVDERHAAKTFDRFPNVKKYKDFRKMFDEMEKSIDAVTVSTPDHFHAVAAMAAIKRKKHFYCQKPLAHSVGEVRALTMAAKQYDVVTQLGNQGHSTESCRLLVEWIRDGAIGNVTKIDCGCSAVNSGLDRLEAVRTERPEVPATLDWDLWLGPTPQRPYHPAYLPGAWRGWVPFGNGTIGDWTCHVIDPVFWALDLGAPKTVQAQAKNWDSKTQGDAYPKGDIITFEFPAKAGRGPSRSRGTAAPRRFRRPRNSRKAANRSIPARSSTATRASLCTARMGPAASASFPRRR